MLWLSLSELLQKLGNAYARTYSVYSLFMITNITIAVSKISQTANILFLSCFQVYGYVSEIVDHGVRFTFKEMGLLVDSMYCMTLLYIFCDCSHKASANIAEDVQLSLMSVKLNSVDISTINEVEYFWKFTFNM